MEQFALLKCCDLRPKDYIMRPTISFIIIKKCQFSLHMTVRRALVYDLFILNKKSDHKRSTLSKRLSQVIMAGIYVPHEVG